MHQAHSVDESPSNTVQTCTAPKQLKRCCPSRRGICGCKGGNLLCNVTWTSSPRRELYATSQHCVTIAPLRSNMPPKHKPGTELQLHLAQDRSVQGQMHVRSCSIANGCLVGLNLALDHICSCDQHFTACCQFECALRSARAHLGIQHLHRLGCWHLDQRLAPTSCMYMLLSRLDDRWARASTSESATVAVFAVRRRTMIGVQFFV